MATGKSEHKEQIDFVGEARKLLRAVGRPRWQYALWAVPNGGKRDKIVAGSLKMEGVLKGVPDLEFAVPSEDHPGLYIEMKVRKGGRVSPEQTKIISVLKELGYRVEVCKGSDEAYSVFAEYLESALKKWEDK